MHELYLWPFQDGLKAGSGNIMQVFPSCLLQGNYANMTRLIQVLIQPREQLLWLPEL